MKILKKIYLSALFLEIMNGADALPFIFLLKSVSLILLLCAASVSDIQIRSVPNDLWIIGILLLSPMIIAEIFVMGFFRLFDIFLSAVLFFLFAAVCFSLHLFGGADGKAFLLISIVFPFNKSDLSNLFGLFSSVPFAALFNSLLLSLIFLFSFFAFCFFKKGISSK